MTEQPRGRVFPRRAPDASGARARLARPGGHKEPLPQARSRGRRSAAEAAETRGRILLCAERLFARKGYRGVSMRELARACGVQVFTVQHHFGSKLRLYEEILRRWDRDVEAVLAETMSVEDEEVPLLDRVVDRLFDFLLAHRDRMALVSRAALGEGLPRQLALGDRTWVRFMGEAMRAGQIAVPDLDIRLLLITLDGILHNHILSAAHYRELFGKDVTDPEVAARTRTHLKKVLGAILDGGTEPQRRHVEPARPR